MKVGVDAVLLGAWTHIPKGDVLEVGTGCGVIPLILAQRNNEINIEAIDIDEESVEEAAENFKNSPWKERLFVYNKDFENLRKRKHKRYDLIISNPPYFKSGILNPGTRREKARHQDTLSVFSLISSCETLLKENGKLSMIFPMEFREEVAEYIQNHRMEILRECRVRDNKNRLEKRIMLEIGFFRQRSDKEEVRHLTLFEDGEPSQEYKELCKDLYLKF